MNKQLIACAVTATLAVTANANVSSDDISAALGNSVEATNAGITGLGNASIQDIRDGATLTYEGSIEPTMDATADAAVQTYNVAIKPAALAVKNAASATGRHIKIYVDVSVDASGDAIDATADAGLATYDHVLVPVGQFSADSATATGNAVEFVAVNAADFAKDVASATADGAKYSWNEVLVPAGTLTADVATDAGELSMDYVLMPTKDAAVFVYENGIAPSGAATGIAASGTLDASGEFSGDVGNATLNAGRRLIGRDAKERRSDERRESEDALNGN